MLAAFFGERNSSSKGVEELESEGERLFEVGKDRVEEMGGVLVIGSGNW